jgi:hypothetical protein
MSGDRNACHREHEIGEGQGKGGPNRATQDIEIETEARLEEEE